MRGFISCAAPHCRRGLLTGTVNYGARLFRILAAHSLSYGVLIIATHHSMAH